MLQKELYVTPFEAQRFPDFATVLQFIFGHEHFPFSSNVAPNLQTGIPKTSSECYKK